MAEPNPSLVSPEEDRGPRAGSSSSSGRSAGCAEPDGEPFLRIHLHREKGEELEPAREVRLREAHGALGDGVPIELETDT